MIFQRSGASKVNPHSMSSRTHSSHTNKESDIELGVPLIESHRDGSSPATGSPLPDEPQKSWINSLLSQPEMLMWCLYWFTANLVITFYNKHVLSSLNASPSTNTFVHMSFTFMGCFVVQRGIFPSLKRPELLRIVLYAFIFSLNIVWCQYAIKLTTLSMNQVCRAMTPLFQAFFSWLIANKVHSMYSLVPIIPVCCGVAMTASAELDLSFTAMAVSLSSIMVSALKGVLSMKILQQDLKEKLQEYSFLILVTPLAALWTVILNLMFKAIYSMTGLEVDQAPDSAEYGAQMWMLLGIGGCMAFAVNVASIGTVKRTSATSMGVMANSKQALTIFMSMILVEPDWTFKKLFGVCITLSGAAWYSYRKEMERQQRTAR